jgi:hypothetical protein
MPLERYDLKAHLLTPIRQIDTMSIISKALSRSSMGWVGAFQRVAAWCKAIHPLPELAWELFA